MIEGLNRQVIEREQQLLECQGQLTDLAAKEAQDSKLQKVVAHQTDTIKALKHELKQVKEQLAVLHQEWVPPSKQKQDLAHLKEVQASVKSLNMIHKYLRVKLIGYPLAKRVKRMNYKQFHRIYTKEWTINEKF